VIGAAERTRVKVELAKKVYVMLKDGREVEVPRPLRA
jgi:LEA14-like dessication related protein